MTDLERRIREVLDDDARSAPPPHEAHRSLGRARRRQTLMVAGGLFGVLAVVAVTVVAVRTVSELDGGTPADAPGQMTTTINGVSVTTPGGWFVADPDTLGLNGSTGDVFRNVRLPRLVLAVSPIDSGELFGCPGMVEDAPRPASLMTVQEGPVALAGGSAAPWPVPLEPLSIESAGGDVVESGEGGCYPGWEFLRAGWTAEGRTFEARVGFSPDATTDDRRAMLDAFATMRFAPNPDAASAAVLQTGTAGGEEWQLIAERQDDGLTLSMQAGSIGGGGGGFDADSSRLRLIDHVLGSGESAERIVFGAVPAEATRLEAVGEDWLGTLEVTRLDVPDEIDAHLDALVFVGPPDIRFIVTAFDAAGHLIASAEVGHGTPTEGPVPEAPADATLEHGGTYWAVYLWVGETADAKAEAAVARAADLGYTTGVGDLACDQGAAEALGVAPDQSGSAVAIYFDSRADAAAASGLFEPAPVGIARVTTFCLD